MLAIIQARMLSKRLKGKMLKKISHLTVLEHVINQVSSAKFIDNIVVATSKHKSDNKICKICKINDIKFYRGDQSNVASRFLKILSKNKFKSFVRISGDSPLIDPKLIDSFITKFKKEKPDILTNIFPRSFPKGQSIEIIKTKIFTKNFKFFKEGHTEHVTNYFYENNKKFNILNITSKKNFSKVRMCVDTLKDFKKIKKMLIFKNHEVPSWKVGLKHL